MRWVRLWEDMPADPKWRTIARKSGQRIGDVMAVFNFMLVLAGQNEGQLVGWDDEDVATALDLDDADVAAIRAAMQGKVLDGDTLSAWGKRQPKREDNSAQRVKRYRDKKAAESSDVTQRNAPVTQCNAPEKSRLDTDSVEPSGSTPPLDLKSAIFDQGLAWIAERVHKPPGSLRPLLGKWCRDYGDASTAEAIASAQREGAVDPIGWISKTLEARNGKRRGSTWGQQLADAALADDSAP